LEWNGMENIVEPMPREFPGIDPAVISELEMK